ncbi:MAG TPA: pseudouridine synthase [Nitrospiria bacterium]|jgi:23S rRNA pseudouridine2605 synthase/16S rRNA pseudouridine516 synthase
MMEERLQKIISQAGITSRRKAEQLIDSGKVTVNGHRVNTLGAKADILKDRICVNGKKINPSPGKVYILLYKPRGFITSLHDPQGRPTVIQLLKGIRQRVYPVGRLDFDTEGILIITNDGDFSQTLMHPKHEIPKTYLAKIRGEIPENVLEKLTKGVKIGGKKAVPVSVKKKGLTEKNSWIEMTLHEGRNRQVKRMFEAVGHWVIKLKRVAYGPLNLKGLSVGEFRFLNPKEVTLLRKWGSR